MNTGKLVLGLLGGVAAGALLGILFAPEKGSKTRKKIINKANDGAYSLKDKFDLLRDAANQKFNDMAKGKDALLSNGEARLNAVKKELKNLDR